MACVVNIAVEDNLAHYRWLPARVHRAAKGGERACNYVDGIVLIVTKFRPYLLCVSVDYYVYLQIFRVRTCVYYS